MTMARAPLTSDEKTILEKFAKTLTKTDSQFCCGGTIQVPSKHTLKLFYNLAASEQAYSINLPGAGPAEIEKLLDACAPAPHGRGAETVYDDSYRLARELHQGEFALTVDIVNNSGILENIMALTSPRNLSGKIVAHLYKLNSYSTGGFFKSHRDTPKSDSHIGTLIVGLPISFIGGELRVTHEGRDILFDLSTAASSNIAAGGLSLPWAFLFSDVEHEVLPVTHGTRVTLAYDIFVSSTGNLPAEPVLDGTTLPLYSEIQEMLKKREFLPHGGKLGLALSHAYPVNEGKGSDFFASRLKGRDAALHRALLALGVPIELRAVYQPDDAEYDDSKYHDAPFPLDGYEPFVTHGNRSGLLYTSKHFYIVKIDDTWEGGETELIEYNCHASLEPEIIWAYKPLLDTYTESGSYIAYGNEAHLQSVYVAAALVLDIAPVGEGVRSFT